MGRHLPLGCVILLMWLTGAAIVGGFLAAEHPGRVVYATDDAYIHMAMARNLADHGVYGVTRHEFSSASSSPLWTMGLAALYRVTGQNELLPLALNALFATLLVIALDRIFVHAGMGRWVRGGLLLAVVFLTPVVPVALTGMEHILQLLLATLFFWRVATSIDGPGHAPADTPTLVLLALLSATRFEGAFAGLAASLLVALRGRWRDAAWLTVAALLPLVAYGVYSVANGALPLPNSVIAKANRPESFDAGVLATHLFSWLRLLVGTPHLLVLLLPACALIALRPRTREAGPGGTFVALVALTAVMHLQFARTGSFYRYEAYLVALAIVGLALVAGEVLRSHVPGSAGSPARAMRVLSAVVMLAAVGYPLVKRSWEAHLSTPQAMANIWQQQYQMGLFLGRAYRGAAVAVNDIGAVSWLADVRILDLQGLATTDVIRLKVSGRYDAASREALASRFGVRVVAVYRKWFGGDERALPSRWVRVGSWTIPNNVVCGSDRVTFYATDEAEGRRLVAALSAFASELPAAVESRIPDDSPASPQDARP